MIELCGGACFLLEPLDRGGVFRQVDGQDLDGHLTLQAHVFGAEDGPHPADRHPIVDVIVFEILARQPLPENPLFQGRTRHGR